MIERTEDYRRVKRITAANPMSEDSPWELIISNDLFYLIEVQDGQDVGVWCFEPDPDLGYLMHTAMTPACRGRNAIKSGLNAIGWLYDNTDAEQIIAPVPVHLRHAQLIPRNAGLEYMGGNEKVKYYKMTRDLFAEITKEAA
jgi:hypothetical protein